MNTTLEEFRIKFLNSDDFIANISEYNDIPFELQTEDVYDILILFKNEVVAVDYICKHYDISREKILYELHQEDLLRKEYGSEKFLRSAQISNDLYIRELKDGTYVLWEAY